MEHVFVASEEHRVVERRSELARPTANIDLAVAALDPAVDDCPSPDVSLLKRSLTRSFVDRELLARHDDRTAYLVGKKLYVRDPALATWVVRREGGDFAEGPHRLCLLGREGGLGSFGHGNGPLL